MSRISQCYKDLRMNGRTAIIPYITAGDPQLWVTVPVMHALVAAGANILELGIPFSDPMSDGPTIRKACERALNNGVTLAHVLDIVKRFREKNMHTPIVLMGYINPIESMGYDRFAQYAYQSGVDGVLIVDMPLEESDEFLPIMEEYDIDTIFLVAPTTSKKRIAKIARYAKGFIYYISIKGVTGSEISDLTSIEEKLADLRRYTNLPLGVGFGIGNGQSAASVSKFADAVVVGSTLVRCISEYADRVKELPIAVAGLLSEIRHAINIQDISISR